MATRLIGQTLLNQFRVDEFIASGGMAAVYRVWDVKRNASLAMKVLHADLADDPTVLKRFQREARALRKLAHPNIVPFYGLYQAYDFSFLLEGYVNGPTLKGILRQQQGNPLPLAETLSVMKALCSALGYAHANGVVHCDVKPGNVMVDPGGAIYLTDFGIARHADSSTTTIGTAGTPAYMAPEQIRGEPVTPATDVYALGVMLFEMLTGQRPFQGSTGSSSDGGSTQAERIRSAHLTQAPPDPRTFDPAISSELAGVVLRALEKDPRRRFQDTMTFLKAICTVAGVAPENIPDRLAQYANTGLEAIASSGSQQGFGTMKQPTLRKALPFLLGAAGILSLFILFLVLNGREKPPPKNPAIGDGNIQPVSSSSVAGNIGLQESTATVSVGLNPPETPALPRSTATSPPATATLSHLLEPSKNAASETQGQWIAYAYGSEQYHRDLYLRDIFTGETRALTTDRKGSNAPTFSPDGSKIAFSLCPNGCSLYTLDLQNLRTTKVGVTMKNMIFSDWCRQPGSPLIAYGAQDGSKRNIFQVNVDTGEQQRITNGGTDIHPSWSPDCNKIVFERYNPNNHDYSDVFIHDLNTQKDTQITFTPDEDELNVSWSPDGNWIAFGRTSQDTNGDGFISGKDQTDLYIIHPDGSGETNLTRGQYSAFGPTWSPDSSQILFTAYYGEGQFKLILYNLANGQFTPLNGNIGPYFHPQWSP